MKGGQKEGKEGGGGRGREEGIILAHNLRIQSIIAGEAWQQVLEAADHVVSAVRKGAMSVVFFFLLSSRPQPRKQCSPQLRWVFPPQLT